MTTEGTPSTDHSSPPWSRTIKVIVALVALLLLALIAQRFQSLIAQIVIAAMIAYILNPIIVLVEKRTKLRRGASIVNIYFSLAVIVVWMLISLGVAAFEQISNLIEQVPALISELLDMLETLTSRTDPILIGSFAIDPRDIPWNGITNQILGLAEPALGRSGQFIRQVTTTTLRWTGNLFFIFVISIYIAIDIPRLGGYIGDFAQRPALTGHRQRSAQR